MEIELDCLRLNFCKNIDVFFFLKGLLLWKHTCCLLKDHVCLRYLLKELLKNSVVHVLYVFECT